MTMKQFRESSRTWALEAHREAAATDDIEFAKSLYEQRIKELEWYVSALESNTKETEQK